MLFNTITLLLLIFGVNAVSSTYTYGAIIYNVTGVFKVYVYELKDLNENPKINVIYNDKCSYIYKGNRYPVHILTKSLEECMENTKNLQQLREIPYEDIHFERIDHDGYNYVVEKINKKFNRFSKVPGRNFMNVVNSETEAAYRLFLLKFDESLKQKFNGFISYENQEILIGYNVIDSIESSKRIHKMKLLWKNTSETVVAIKIETLPKSFFLKLHPLSRSYHIDLKKINFRVCNCSRMSVIFHLKNYKNNKKCVLISPDQIELYPFAIGEWFSEENCKNHIVQTYSIDKEFIASVCDNKNRLIYPAASGGSKFIIYLPEVLQELASLSSLDNIKTYIKSRCKEFEKADDIQQIFAWIKECQSLQEYLNFLIDFIKDVDVPYEFVKSDDRWLKGYAYNSTLHSDGPYIYHFYPKTINIKGKIISVVLGTIFGLALIMIVGITIIVKLRKRHRKFNIL